MAKKKYDALDLLGTTAMTPGEAPLHPLWPLHDWRRLVNGDANAGLPPMTIDNRTGVEAYNYCVQHPERFRDVMTFAGPGTLEDELGHRCVTFIGPGDEVWGATPEELSKVGFEGGPITMEEFKALTLAIEAERQRQKNEEDDR